VVHDHTLALKQDADPAIAKNAKRLKPAWSVEDAETAIEV
tara:strand:- start:358 stop:477 length:120 start_codon:yes stop_codon:yes gene_type:complete